MVGFCLCCTLRTGDPVDAYNTERALRKIKRRNSFVAPEITVPDSIMKDNQAGHFVKVQAKNFKEQSGRTFDTGRAGFPEDTIVHKKNINLITKDTHPPVSTQCAVADLSSRPLNTSG
ncbi:hypothetical protein KSP40_PGU016071 [Platanthera guangdongensis]|uniref:Uncharacterized protein n=1 Tax=Platanthera guangdongensis TaxID=2320717 RepID=A0ABR2M8R5_9ASPA